MRRFVFALLLLILGAVSFTACSSTSAETSSSASPNARAGGSAAPVETAKSVRKNVPFDLQMIGTVEPLSTVSVHSQVTGQLETVNFTEGDEVRQGQVLFTLDRRPLEAIVKQAEATLQRDTAQAANADTQLQRVLDLQARGIATREQRDTSQANAEALQATLGADRAALENARIQLQYATITAPLTGRTGALMVHNGSLVRANDTTPLVVINQLSPINVSFAVPEAQLGMLKKVMSAGRVPVGVSLPEEGSDVAEGRVTFVDNAVDQTTGTIRVKASFTNTDHRLWPGQYVNVALTLSTDTNVVVVPASAVQSNQDGAYVFVVKADQTAELRPVKVSRTAAGQSIVTNGLQADETVITDGQLRVVPGGKVAPRAARAAPTTTGDDH